MSADWQAWNTNRSLNPIEFWLDAVRSGIMDTDFAASEPQFEGAMYSRQHQDIRLVNFTNSPHRIFRRAPRLRRTTEDSLILSFQWSGTAHILQGRKEGVSRPGDFCLLDTSSAFEVAFPQHTKRSLVVMPRHALGARLPVVMRSFGPLFIRKEDTLAPLLKELVVTLTNHQRSTQRQSVETLVGALAAVLGMHFVDAGVSVPTATESSFEIVKRYVERHLADAELSAAQVASACRVSLRTLHRLFARHGDTSFEAYLIRSRLDMANDLLGAAAAASVTEIAYACGFNNPSHFTKRYTERFGHPPSHALKKRGLPR